VGGVGGGGGLKITGVQSSDGGVYECHAENAVGSSHATANLTVLSTSYLITHSPITQHIFRFLSIHSE